MTSTLRTKVAAAARIVGIAALLGALLAHVSTRKSARATIAVTAPP